MAARDEKLSERLAVYEPPGEARRRTWVQMVRTVSRVERRLVGALGERDVTLPQFDVLATLRFGEGVTQQELAERLLVTKGNVCGVLDRLERLGWVERRPDPNDRRANRLHLTPAGRRKVDALLPAHDALVLHALRSLSDVDVQTLRRLLASIEAAVADNGEAASE
jgi:DNA-binding MarR family transcriptional regulator